MQEALWLIPAMPAAAFVLLAMGGARMARPAVAALGTLPTCASAVVALAAAWRIVAAPPADGVLVQRLWTWVAPLGAAVQLRMDGLSAVMTPIIAVVAAMILIYSIGYMAGDAGYSRFFAYMNLFVAAMLLLVLADNLLALYAGWEGVGLCSFLLIGFWYDDPDNAGAARKAFIVTRIGDTAFFLGLLLCYVNLGTLDIQGLIRAAERSPLWAAGSFLPTAAALLILFGALGKSAQLPLQTWLPDAMAGPTPVSALIHAATMVIAGVYLVARMNGLFLLAPRVMELLAAIGAATLIYAGLAAAAQRDIKRALAYSTMSQIGLMFLALGLGAWAAGIFHFATHAFFKPLLFMGAGAVILAMHHDKDMFRMGALRRAMPLEFWTFLAGAASLAALPLVTAGYWSKEAVLRAAWAGPNAGFMLWSAAAASSFLTALYAFRIVSLTFLGAAARTDRTVAYRSPLSMWLPMVILAMLSIAGGLLQWRVGPEGAPLLDSLLARTLPAGAETPYRAESAGAAEAIAIALTLAGVVIAYVMYSPRRESWTRTTATGALGRLAQATASGFGFDELYHLVFVRPFAAISRVLRRDWIDASLDAAAWLFAGANRLLSRTQSGNVRWYLWVMAAGAAVLVALAVWK